MKNEDFRKKFVKRLIDFSIEIIRFSDKFCRSKRIYESIARQLIRCSTSIGANIVEAKASSSKRDYLKFFQIALKSANETLYWLYLIKETDQNQVKKADILLKETNEICKIIASSILTMKNKKKL